MGLISDIVEELMDFASLKIEAAMAYHNCHIHNDNTACKNVDSFIKQVNDLSESIGNNIKGLTDYR